MRTDARSTYGLAPLLGVLLLSGPVAVSGAADPTTWTAVATSGGVEARRALAVEGDWQSVQRGDELPQKALLRTGKRGRATLTRHASVLIVDPNSQLELPDSGAGDIETSVVQTAGSVVYEVERRSRPHFEVVTPHLVAGVKGTSFLVTVTEDFTAVIVQRGLVEVTNPANGAVADVGPGESVFLGGSADRPESLDYREAAMPDALRETKRMDRMERREQARLEREQQVDDDSDEPGAGMQAKSDAHAAGIDWVGDSDAAGYAGEHGKDGDSGATGWEEEAFSHGKGEPGGDAAGEDDKENDKENDKDHGKPEDPDEPEDPDDDPVQLRG